MHPAPGPFFFFFNYFSKSSLDMCEVHAWNSMIILKSRKIKERSGNESFLLGW
jgi:hypothetical protein